MNFICFFEDSVNGLEPGAPVKFKGVTIGKVSAVLLRAQVQAEGDNTVPVIIEIDDRRLSQRGVAEHIGQLAKQKAVQENGLRARLQQVSMVTGLLFVDLDFHPGTPAVFHKKDPDDGLPEVPTLASHFGTLMRAATRTVEQLSQIEFVAMGNKMDRILAQVETSVALIDLKAINQSILKLTKAANDILQDPQVTTLPANINATLAAIRELSRKLEGQVDPVAAELKMTTEEMRKALAQIDRTAESLRQLVKPGSGLRVPLEEALRQIAEAAWAVRALADYLERNPGAIVSGKAGIKHAESADVPVGKK
ncbi:MAG: MlaD family protein [Puniceicoccales bacterium]|nr:MlaD family protein [Puniceicoccales bacterium]